MKYKAEIVKVFQITHRPARWQPVIRRSFSTEARVWPKPVHVGFLVDDLALATGFSLNTAVSPCQYHSTKYPYSYFIHIDNWQRYEIIIDLESGALPLAVFPRHQTNVRDPRVVSTDLGQSFLAPFTRLPHRLINTPTTSIQLVILLTSGWSAILSTQCHCGILRAPPGHTNVIFIGFYQRTCRNRHCVLSL